MKKIMLYCNEFYPRNTGYSNAFQNLVNSILQHDQDVEITVVTPDQLEDGIEELKRERLSIIRLKAKIKIKILRYFLNPYFYAKTVSKIFLRNNFDLLIVETFDSAIFLNSLNKKIYERLAVRIHSTNETEYTIFGNSFDFKLRKYIIKKYLTKKIKWILSTNSFHIDFVKKYYFNNNLINIGEKNFFVLPNTVEINSSDDYIVGEKIKIFTLGRMDYLGNNQKGFSDFIYALKLLPRDIMNRFDIKVVGAGDMKNSLVSLCSEFSNVSFIDSMPHSDILSELKNSDVVLLPSRYEGLSMFALEGLSTGNACLFSRTGGLVDMIENNGIFFEHQNIESLALAMSCLSKLSKDELLEMKQNSITLCQRKFSPEIVVEKFKLIFSVITGSN
ncbi:glycosyl transferase [Shewanella sp. NFH-SH190041]|uniref:glycosyltransferase family 4 protein n=1 Tax=Shewanella sp. NFH-SH190041 TaxID=2950245 RepID=UPI0021C367FB|nr:glycosyltransferase family 4 protein [Shewanella sp. NFH-SH190041]BDM65195.1 glycosyl transferase [Shewanella sp. NFH-SH190041]